MTYRGALAGVTFALLMVSSFVVPTLAVSPGAEVSIGSAFNWTAPQFHARRVSPESFDFHPAVGGVLVTTIPVGGYPLSSAFDSINDTLYVAIGAGKLGNVSVINTSKEIVADTIPDAYAPTGIAFDSASGDVYVANFDGSNVSVFSSATNKLVATVPVGASPYGVAVDPASGNVYVSHYYGSNVTVIDSATEKSTQSVATGTYPMGVTFDSQNGDIYVANQESNNVSVINGSSSRLVGSVETGESGTGSTSIAYDPTNGFLYVSNAGSGNVSVINGSSNQLIGGIQVLQSTEQILEGVAYDSSNGVVYVATTGGSIELINASTNSVIGSVNASFESTSPRFVTYDPSNRLVYVSPGAPDNVSAINGSVIYPAISSFRANPSSVTVGNGTTLSVAVVDHPADIAYAYTGLPPGCTSVDLPAVSCTPTRAGSYLVTVYVNDSLGIGTNLTTEVGVNVFPILSFGPDPAVVDVGVTTRFTVDAVGGIGTLSYDYTGLPPGCASANRPSLACDPTSAGTFDIKVFVNDTEGNSANSTTALVVDLAPSVVAIATPSPTDANATTVLSASTTGGTGPFNYTWIFNGSIRAYGVAAAHVFPSPGNDTVRVYANDTFGLVSVGMTTVRVYPQLVVDLASSNETPLLGQTVAFVTTVSGGLGPFNYTYTGFPPGCVSEDKPAIGCLPTQADFYNITVGVRDQNGITANSTAMIHVVFDFNVVVPSNTSAGSPFTISVNTNETFSGGTAVLPEGGIGTLTYNYTGLPPGCASQDKSAITCTPMQVGRYFITVNVHDQVGDHNSHTVVVNVVPAKSSNAGSSSPFSGAVGYSIIGAIVAAAGVVGVLFVLRSRRKKSETGFVSPPTAGSRPPGPPT
jgi:YVTN family beta-propeller protein